MQDPFARNGLAAIYQALKGVSPGDLTSPERAQLVLKTVQQAAATGELVSIRAKAVATNTDTISGGGGSTRPQPPPRKPRSSSAPPPPRITPEKTWVDIQLLDPSGNPVPGAKYKLKITDGSVREGTLDDQGRVHVAGLDPGSCTVWFPDYDAKEWRPQ
ncbi:MAG TPA: carboxypeptidase-like regulatory domain-containing protein [Bryobacteraceae bacterium]